VASHPASRSGSHPGSYSACHLFSRLESPPSCGPRLSSHEGLLGSPSHLAPARPLGTHDAPALHARSMSSHHPDNDPSGASGPPHQSGNANDAQAFPGIDDDFGLTPRPKGKFRLVDPLIGADLGGVRITSLIGEGGMGRVYQAQQESPARTVAVKVIRFGISNQQTLRRFEREAEFLGRLEHPGIARIIAVGTYESTSGDTPFFVMEYVSGARPITHYASELSLSLESSLRLFRRVCEAVAHGHQRGIIHRDLKPGNILIDGDGNPKVIDFGVATSTDSDLTLTKQKTDTGALVGTVQHMAPEQFSGTPAGIDARADVYSLGVVLYELLAGELPYQISKKAMHDAARIVCEEVPRTLKSRDKTIPLEVSLIAERCLQKGRGSRYRNAGELAADIGRFLDGKPLSARTTSLATRYWRSAARLLRRKWLVVSLTMLLGLAGLALYERLGAQPGTSDGTGQRANGGEGGAGGALAQVPAPVISPAQPPAENEKEDHRQTSLGSPAPTPEAEAIRQGVIKALTEQFAACNEEDIGRLRDTYSAEHRFHERDFGWIESGWATNDSYCRLDRVDLLADSDAPRAKFEPPYATVRVTQTVIELPVGDERNQVFRRRCRENDSDLLGLAERLGYRNRRIEATSVELLYKQEDGDWKFVTAVAEPVGVGTTGGTRDSLGLGVPFQRKSKPSGSAFN